LKKIFAILSLFILPYCLQATHLVGGIIELKWISGSNYQLTVRVLRDCENGNPVAYFDSPISVGIFEKNTHIKRAQFSLNFVRINDDTLKFTGDNCASVATGCTHVGTYRTNITLPDNVYNSNNGYYLSYQRCCRNDIIENLVNPGGASLTLYAELPNLRTVKNSTPRYTNNPNTLMCVNNFYTYNMDFVDDDGDELRFSFINPLNGNLDRDNPVSTNATPGPYTNTVWKNGYDNSNPILGSAPLSINPVTGQISCNPNAPGVYVASIRVEEYRFNVKIGEVRLELQYTVSNCPNNPPLASIIQVNGQLLMQDTVYIPIPEKACFKIRAIDLDDSVYLQVKMGDLDSTIVNRPIFDSLTEGYKLAETEVCWQSACELEKLSGGIPFFVFAYDNGCPFPKNASTKFVVKFTPMAIANSTDLLCMTLENNAATYVYYGDSTSLVDPNFAGYLVYRGINYQNFEIIDTITTKSERFFYDGNTPNYDRINYTYFMRSINKCNIQGPSSDTLSTFEQLAYIPQQQFLKYITVVNNESLELEWPASTERDFARYFLYKNKRGEAQFKLLATFENVNDTKYLDEDVRVSDTSYCYHLVMKDTCDNIGPQGKVACSIVLRGKSEKYMSRLNWQEYLGWQEGVESYELHRADPANDFTIVSNHKPEVFTCLDDKLNFNEGLFYYYINAKQKDDTESTNFFNAESRSNTILLYQPPIVYTPNAFTANGDGLNDTYQWVPVFVKDFKIQIYDRYGERIFETNNKNEPWDGKYKGAPCQEAVYFYILRYTGWDGSDESQSGNFTLLR
jgi:gliding motility-associated-like protein